jgi:hypothetical protein
VSLLAGAFAVATAACVGSNSSSLHGTLPCPAIAHTGPTTVPRVINRSFTSALARLLQDHLLVSVPHFIPFHDAMAEQGWGRLANYTVTSETPHPGTTQPAGTVVTLKLSNPVFNGQLGSMGEPTHHPRYAHIPTLRGKTYPQAMATATEKSGILVRVSSTAALRPAESSCGLRGFTVSTQTPKPGTRVLWGGINTTGVEPALSTVTITLKSRTAAGPG